jgi:hypothetical protein
MSTLAQATAAPAPLMIGGKEYMASPVTLADLGAIEERVKAAYIATARLSGDDSVVDLAITKAMGITYRSPQMFAYLNTEAGAYAFIFLSLKHRQPDLDERAVTKALRENVEQLAVAVETVMRISGLGKKEGGAPGEAKAGEANGP